MNNLTQEQVSELSEQGLAERLISLIYPDSKILIQSNEVAGNVRMLELDGQRVVRLPDYCNNWNDLMPLVVEYGVTLYRTSRRDGWLAVWDCGIGEISIANENPQRALAECLFLVLQEKANNE